jgi:hypothetical protein
MPGKNTVLPLGYTTERYLRRIAADLAVAILAR